MRSLFTIISATVISATVISATVISATVISAPLVLWSVLGCEAGPKSVKGSEGRGDVETRSAAFGLDDARAPAATPPSERASEFKRARLSPPAAPEPQVAGLSLRRPAATVAPPASTPPPAAVIPAPLAPPASDPLAAPLCGAECPDIQPPGREHRRVMACAGALSPAAREHVTALLTERLQRNPSDPGFDRFLTLGASASRNMYFLTGFGRGNYQLAPSWSFLEPTIRYFSRTPRRNSFLRKDATVSGTTAGSYIWPGDHCPDCPERLTRELNALRPAFAVIMFGTNNIRWRGPPGARRWFLRPQAAGFADPACAHKTCVAPWQPGPFAIPPDTPDDVVRYVKDKLVYKQRRFRRGLDRLIDRLLAQHTVPLLSTIPPMPRRWPDEDTVVAINAEIRAAATQKAVPLIDLWCAMHPTVQATGQSATAELDWTHPVLTNNKGIGTDRYHPQAGHAFELADENLIYGYNLRNTLTLVRLRELMELAETLRQSSDSPAASASPR